MQPSNFIDVQRNIQEAAAASWIAAQQHKKTGNTTCSNTKSNAPDDGRKRPKHVELKEHQ
jgi:hypothetical protein